MEKTVDRPVLAVVFDLDGTLISEDSTEGMPLLRPGVIDMLRRVRANRMKLAIFTAASEEWCAEVKQLLCQKTCDQRHDCDNLCTRTFVSTKWDKHLVQQGHPSPWTFHRIQSSGGVGCHWCGMQTCERCLMSCNGCDGYCPCRNVKMLFRFRPREVFTRERTLIVENTVQQCVHNFGNAVYVPTYEDGEVEGGGSWRRLGTFYVG